jgi:hypothetical protein
VRFQEAVAWILQQSIVSKIPKACFQFVVFGLTRFVDGLSQSEQGPQRDDLLVTWSMFREVHNVQFYNAALAFRHGE